MRYALLLAISLLFTSCAARMVGGFNKIQPGMTKAQVAELAGEPHSKSHKDGVDRHYYRLASSFMDTDGSDTRDYYAEFKNGVLTSYGPNGDGPTKKSSSFNPQAFGQAMARNQANMNQQQANMNQFEQNLNGPGRQYWSGAAQDSTRTMNNWRAGGNSATYKVTPSPYNNMLGNQYKGLVPNQYKVERTW